MSRDTVTIHLIAGPKQLDAMMHAFDVFEVSKRLATIRAFDVSFEGQLDAAGRKKMVDAFKLAAEQGEGAQRVVACFIAGDIESAFIDETVQTISDGKRFQLLDPILQNYGVRP